VSIVLKALGVSSVAWGIVAGFVGKEIQRRTERYGVRTEFVEMQKGISRMNVKVITPVEETAINGKGARIDEKTMEVLEEKLEKLEAGDILVLAGSVSEGVPQDIYAQMCKKVGKKEVRIVVDTTGELLLQTLPYHPFLIKPNQEELEEIFQVKIATQEEALTYARKLQEKGARNVLVSMGSKGAVLLDENGNVYKEKALYTDRRKNTVGAGDSMVAGFIAGYEKFQSYERALHMGIVAATATMRSMFLATKEEIEALWNTQK